MDYFANDKLVLYAIPFFLFMVGAEAFSAWRRRNNWYQKQDAFASLAMGVGNVIVTSSLKGFWLAGFIWLYENRLFDIDPSLLWVWVGGLFLQDFCFYWYHRAGHRIRLLWAAHENHHSSEKYNFTTALRQSWTTPLFNPVFFMPMAVLGFHPIMIVTYQGISLIYQFLLHTESVGKLGPLEWFMNTPSHHRVHHGCDEQYLDCNYAGIFIIWDRLFGSFVPEREPVTFGLVGKRPSFNPLHIAVHHYLHIARDLREARNPSQALGILFRGPEWWGLQKTQNNCATSATAKPVPSQ